MFAVSYFDGDIFYIYKYKFRPDFYIPHVHQKM